MNIHWKKIVDFWQKNSGDKIKNRLLIWVYQQIIDNKKFIWKMFVDKFHKYIKTFVDILVA